MNIKNRLKRWFKPRFAVLYPLAIFVVLFGSCDDSSLKAGIWLVLAGLSMRVWANGYAIKLDKLTTCGPYAFVRHPLYTGTILIIIGFIVMLRVYYMGLFFLALTIFIYYNTIKKEEKMLEEKFDRAYMDYKRIVPSVLPSPFPYRGGQQWPFSLKRLIKSQEYKPVIWITIAIIIFYLKGKLLVEHKAPDGKMAALIIAALILASIDLTGEIIRKGR